MAKARLARARHQRIDVVLVVLVEGAGAGRGDQHGERQHERAGRRLRPGPRRDGETGERGKHDDEADAQLEQYPHSLELFFSVSLH